jgi:hypothetical protein
MKKFLLLCPLIFLLTFCRSKKVVQETPEKPVEQTSVSREIIPFFYFQFEKSQSTKLATSSVAGNNISIKNPLPLSSANSPAGDSWRSGRGDAYRLVQIENAPARNKNLTVEIAIKFDPDSMDKFEMGFSAGQFTISPGLISVTTPDTSERKIQFVLDDARMRGMNEYIYDGSWHHFAFRFSGDSLSEGGTLAVFIDGKKSWQRKTKTNALNGGNRFSIDFASAAHSSKNYIDELAIFTEALPDAQVIKHSADFFSGKHYTYSFIDSDEKIALIKSFRQIPLAYDTLAFAPGFPEYTVSQNDQLNSFPLPRYKKGTTLHRNFPWFDLMYTAYDYSQTQALPDAKFKYPGMKGESHAEDALEMNLEMYRHWNYYFNIPSPTFNVGDIGNTKTISGKQVAYANLHPEIQISTYTFWTGLRPDRAGFDSQKPYIRSDANIDPCKGDGTFPNIQKDGITQRENLKKLVRYLPARDSLKKIDFICENGEVFGESHTPNAEGYRGSKFISCIQQDSATARRDRAKWQYDVFHAYSSQFIGSNEFPALKKTDFAFYQVAGFMPAYYSEFQQMRKINANIRGDYYSTPDFYPGHAGWKMWETHGPYHGLDVIQEGRKAEIKSGDAYFSPFICAGWFQDTANFRPAEWLSATKALAMMGAEFYYPSYFNLTDPGKKKPMDPRGYIYQVAVPSYAQAITSRYEDIFLHSKNFNYHRNYNRITIYREDTLTPGRYAIHASIYAASSYSDALPDSISNHVKIDGDILKINFVPQGATYIYDKSDPKNIVFYQLDGWHEKDHPYYWSKDFLLEAELYEEPPQTDRPFAKIELHTGRPANALAGDYTNYTTWISMSKSNTNAMAYDTRYYFEPRADADSIYYIWIRARTSSSSPEATSGVITRIDNLKTFPVNGIEKGKFQWYCVGIHEDIPARVAISSGKEHFIKLELLDAYVEVDKILLSHSDVKPQ